MSDSKITVVIPHLNQHDMLARCLASLQDGTRQADEVIVVDNGSAEMPHAVCDTYGATLLREETPGPGPARNFGVANSSNDILAFIDADCLADPLWLEAAHDAMSDPAAQILGGDVRIALVDPARITVLEAYESIYAYRMDKYIAKEGFTGTGNLVVRRPVLEAVGPFAGLSVAEDKDWGQRATAMGYEIRYVAGMKAYHPARETFSQLRAKWDRHIAHEFVERRGGLRSKVIWLAKTGALLVSPLAEIPKILFSDRIAGAGSGIKAWIGLVAIRSYRAGVMAKLSLTRDPGALSGRWNRPKA
ncbi:glycosyl transferase family 2 [Rhodobacteraceae bacterium (ex Bugula neritina AB1)]|nr:glycosyl transferase family 2 [Rhodobacteraceae bacterium (ex Bugula neritina AB1)]